FALLSFGDPGNHPTKTLCISVGTPETTPQKRFAFPWGPRKPPHKNALHFRGDPGNHPTKTLCISVGIPAI
ncbi:MAG: hypothetical protein WCQ59_04435, partial [Candidatus Cloacimonadaceae bacterium]